MTHPRIACVVPGCRRGTTRYPPGFTIICGKCYRLVDRSLKLRRARAKRRGRLGQEAYLWELIIRQAIERSAGIG